MSDTGFVEGVLAGARRARRRLSIEEVLEAGLPAVYEQYGERLLYLDGRILDASDPAALGEVMAVSTGTSNQAVGLDFGWRHVSECSCVHCATRPGKAGTATAVRLPRRQ